MRHVHLWKKFAAISNNQYHVVCSYFIVSLVVAFACYLLKKFPAISGVERMMIDTDFFFCLFQLFFVVVSFAFSLSVVHFFLVAFVCYPLKKLLWS